jgi:hypothetical protein
MTENAGIENAGIDAGIDKDPRVAAAGDEAAPPPEEGDATQRTEDPAAVAAEPERLYDA